jgi:hypothetical protein
MTLALLELAVKITKLSMHVCHALMHPYNIRSIRKD